MLTTWVESFFCSHEVSKLHTSGWGAAIMPCFVAPCGPSDKMANSRCRCLFSVKILVGWVRWFMLWDERKEAHESRPSPTGAARREDGAIKK